MALEATQAAIAALEKLHEQAVAEDLGDAFQHYLDLISTFSQDALTALNSNLGWGSTVEVGSPFATYVQNAAGLLTILSVKVIGAGKFDTYRDLLGHQIDWLRKELSQVAEEPPEEDAPAPG